MNDAPLFFIKLIKIYTKTYKKSTNLTKIVKKTLKLCKKRKIVDLFWFGIYNRFIVSLNKCKQQRRKKMAVCKFCGKELVEGSSFCAYCGQKIAKLKNVVLCELGADTIGLLKYLSEKLNVSLQEVIKKVNALPLEIESGVDEDRAIIVLQELVQFGAKAQMVDFEDKKVEVVDSQENKTVDKTTNSETNPFAIFSNDNKQNIETTSSVKPKDKEKELKISKKSQILKIIRYSLYLVGTLLLTFLPLITINREDGQLNISVFNMTVKAIESFADGGTDILSILYRFIYLLPAISLIPMIVSSISAIIKNIVAYCKKKIIQEDLYKTIIAKQSLSVKTFIGVIIEILFVMYYYSGFNYNYINIVSPIIVLVVAIGGEITKLFDK